MNDRNQQPVSDRRLVSIMGSQRDIETLKICQARTAVFLDRLHGKVVAALDESIAQLSAIASPRDEEIALLEDLRLLRLHGDRLGSELRDHFARHYQDDTGAGPSSRRAWLAAEAPGESGFSLVDDQQLDEWLAIDRLVGKIADTHGDALQALTQRFQQLLPGRDDPSCPLGADRFCHAFHDALVSLDVSPGMRIRCYELLYRILVPEIGEFYPEINQLLISRGVLPQVRVEAAGHRPARGGAERQQSAIPENAWSDAIEPDGGGPADAAPERRTPTPIHQQMFQAMQHLLRAHFSEGGVGGAAAEIDAGDPAASLPVTPMLVDTLSALQRDDDTITHAGELIRGGLRQQVVGRFAGGRDGAGGGINRIDDETIEVISMIFDYILDDHALPDFMKALIGRLQIPVLKVAIIDREFFSRKSHPARQLLNELSHAGLGWREESEAAKDRLYHKMESIVRRILDEFENDIGIFAELLADFRAYLEEESRGYSEAQTRLLEAAQQQEQRERIRIQLAAEFAKRLFGLELPAEVREFLLTPWRTHVTAVVLEHGADSGAATAAFGFIDDLIWSLQPKYDPDERKRLVRMLPVLLDTLRAGMRHIDHPEDEVERIILSLQDLHFECMKSGRRNPEAAQPVPPSAPPAPAAGAAGDEVDRVFAEISREIDELSSIDWDRLSRFDDVVEQKPDAQHAFERMIAEMGLKVDRDDGPRIDDEYTDLVRGLELGAWVELTAEDGGTLRGKLAWKGDDYSSFSFVNRQCKVIAERPFYVLADDFRLGKASVIEDVALFDRAVDGVVSGIMKLAASAR